MIRNGPWAALWCPWLVPAGSCNAPTSQQLLRGYLTILPPAHQYYRYNKQESESGHWKKGEKKVKVAFDGITLKEDEAGGLKHNQKLYTEP